LAKKRVAKILVNDRTISIGGEVLAIRHIVGLHPFEYGERKQFTRGRELAFTAGMLVAVFSAAYLGSGPGSSSDLSVGVTLFVLGLLAALRSLYCSLRMNVTYYFAIELSNGRLKILSAKQSRSRDGLLGQIRDVMGNPPERPTSLRIDGDVYAVDARDASKFQVGGENSQFNF